MQDKKQQLELYMEQQTGSKSKGVCQACILSPCLFNLYAEYIVWSAEPDEEQTGMKIQLSSVQSSCSFMPYSLQAHGLQHARLHYSSLTPGAYSNSCPLSRWSHPTISTSVIPFSLCLQSFPTSGSFQMSQLFALGDQIIGVSATVLQMYIQDWFPLGWTGWISLQSKGLSRVFSNTTVQNHQCFSAQLF